MNFEDLHKRLRLEIWRRIDGGNLSSSLLAGQTGLAQAHISNFLHGRRRLSLSALDRVLQAQSLSVEDLSPEPAHPHALIPLEAVPIVPQSIALAAPILPLRLITSRLQLPAGWLTRLPIRRAFTRRSWDRFVAVRVSPAQAASMDPVLRPGSLAVLDRHYNSLAPCHPPHPNVYAVRVGNQMFLRYVAFEASRLVLRPRLIEYPVDVVELAADESPSDFLVGRVCLCLAEL